jgi:type III secretion system OrgA/MxiK family protein
MSSSSHERLPAQLLRVMYDPVAYAEASTYEARSGTASVAWENRRLIEQHQLACRIDFTIDAEQNWWIEHWSSLRRIAFLIGCRCLRDTLVAERHLLRLDAVARRFALLPIVAPRASIQLAQGRCTDDTVLHAQGFQVIDSITTGLPYALRQRLSLMFRDVERLSRDGAIAGASAPYPMLISTASRYAQAHPN